MGRDIVGWAGGGSSWNDDPAPPPPPPEWPPKREGHVKDLARFGPAAPLGDRGVVCGRFLPVHRGHEYVIEFARTCVEKLVVVVFASPRDAISGELRAKWIRELAPNVHDVRVETGEKPELEQPDFPVKFAATIRKHSSYPIKYLFGSEPAYASAALALGATFVPVDPARVAIPISGTAIRADVMRHFEMLPACVRPAFVRRIAVIGAEATGKSSLCVRLAEAYATRLVPEYARVIADQRGGALPAEAMQLVARGQLASEDALARFANRVLICDTDVRTVRLWSERLFDGDVPPWIPGAVEARPYDLVLRTSTEVPFVGSPSRDRPAERRAFHDQLAREVPDAVELRGTPDEQLATARDRIDHLIDSDIFLSARGRRMA